MGKLMDFFRSLFDSWLNRDGEDTPATETTVPETTAETTQATEGDDMQDVEYGPDGEVIPVETMPDSTGEEPAETIPVEVPADAEVPESEAGVDAQSDEGNPEDGEAAGETSVNTETPADEQEDPSGAEEPTDAENPGEAADPVAAVVTDDSEEQTEEPEATETTEMVAVPSEPEEPGFIGGFLDGGWLYALLGLLAALIIGVILRMVEMRREEQRRKQRARRRKQARETTAVGAETAPVTQEAAEPAAMEVSGMASAVFQEIGAREDQQDSYGMTDPALYHSQGVLALVADGMGGLANGKAVSSVLVNTFLGGFNKVSGYDKPQEILLDLAIRANYTINEHFRSADRSGSTLVSVMVREGKLHFLTVGDSRIYLYRAGVLMQLNREHTYQEELAVKAVNRQVPIGQVTADRQAHALTSFFGIGTIPYMDRNDQGIKLVKGDRILLCSDGVFGTLSQEQMEFALQRDVKEAAAMMRDLIREADRPYQDNNTGLILEYLG